jgi:transposase-like protein
VNHFGPMIAADLRKRRPKPYTTWHLDEVYLKISGRMVYLWRAVDAEGEVLDLLVQSKRNKRTRRTFFELRTSCAVPRRGAWAQISTDCTRASPTHRRALRGRARAPLPRRMRREWARSSRQAGLTTAAHTQGRAMLKMRRNRLIAFFQSKDCASEQSSLRLRG